ncbi:XkdW family protein [Bacillus badius]|uniref:Uncharacterized protein n=1 Tax=Bacillus badius TaxID=1455 RepID=A0ABR5B1V5_BACBA|nr:XkdW family protein [Bacillus badius]KIL80745.1 hypothetical protein SD77_0593 [Bacillus badius]MED4715326.1 XkdW family protein [Bacillus badius]UAT31980.1 XkdW family protein [Bacillus badius]GLY12201.1 hypothetical protein Bbad01_34170 [Bacillus badius]
MRSLKQTDLRQVQQQRNASETLPFNMESLGEIVVKERLARLQAEQKLSEMGKQLVDLKLSILTK